MFALLRIAFAASTTTAGTAASPDLTIRASLNAASITCSRGSQQPPLEGDLKEFSKPLGQSESQLLLTRSLVRLVRLIKLKLRVARTILTSTSEWSALALDELQAPTSPDC